MDGHVLWCYVFFAGLLSSLPLAWGEIVVEAETGNATIGM
jgi:hypothetical protein